MSTPSWIRTQSNIVINFDNEYSVVSKDHVNYKLILAALKAKDYSNLSNLLTPGNVVKDAVKGKFDVINGIVYRNGDAMPKIISDRIISYMKEDLPFDSLVAFSDRVLLNPSMTTRDRLYSFLENNGHPLTDDGCFIAYKRVTTAFKDFYTGKFDNSVGATPSMPRNEVDDDHNNTCSRGLHVCSWEYLPHYHNGDGVVIECKVDPANVVAIPFDYENMKMRTCGYTVLSCAGALPHLNKLTMGHVPKCAAEETGFNDLAPAEDQVEDADNADNDDNVDYTLEDDTNPVGVIASYDVRVRDDLRVEFPSALIDAVGEGFGKLSVFKKSFALDISADGGLSGDFYLEKGVRLTKSFMTKNLPHVSPGDFLCIQLIQRSNGGYRIVVS